MSYKYSREELSNLDKDTLITLFLSLQDQMEKLNQNMETLIEQIAVMNQKRFGRSTEKLTAINDQMTLEFNEAESILEQTGIVEEQTIPAHTRKKHTGKREEDLAGLPVEVIEHSISDAKLKKLFGEKWKSLEDDVYHRLRVEPAKYIVEEHHIKVYAGCDNQTIVRADHPAELLEHSIVTPSLAASIINEKYVNAVPLYRQEQELKRKGISISRQVMANWVIQCSDRWLSPFYDYLHSRMMKEHLLQADETPVLVTKDGRPAGSKSYMWAYRTGEGCEKPIILYDYQKTRKTDHPREFLKGFRGVLVTDGYQVYHTLSKEQEDLKIAGCWSHARRKFADAVKSLPKEQRDKSVAEKILEVISELYDDDRNFSRLTLKERQKQRKTVMGKKVDRFFEWLRELQDYVTPNSSTGKGIQYCLNQERYLRYFLEDGSVPMDNNAAERAIRGFTIGRKNWVIIDTIGGAEASAILYSLVETAKANELNPYEYICHLLTEIPKHENDLTGSYLSELLPWSKNLPEKCHKKLK